MKPLDRRVVITGLGLVTPLGNDVPTNWDSLRAGRSGIASITRFDASALPVRFAGEVRGFDPSTFIDRKDIKRMDPFTHYAVAAARMAAGDARLSIGTVPAERVGVLVGVGMGGIATIEEYLRVFFESGLKKVTPFFVPRLIANMAPGQIAMCLGAKGVNFTATSACASGGHAIGEAYRQVRFGFQDVMFAGGAEAAVTAIGVGGFAVMRALSTRNDEPARASRPFDKQRDGFVIAEGAAMLVVEPLEDAVRRGARIYAEIAGYGANADAYHITMPSPEGEGAARCMQLALDDGEINPLEVDYINAHGTSTPYNDVNETQAIKRVFGEHAARLAVSSTKSMTGHALGAAGAIEAAYVALTLHHGVIPPTINYEYPDPDCDLDYVPNRSRRAAVRVALSNSFGFGGANACLAFRRYGSDTATGSQHGCVVSALRGSLLDRRLLIVAGKGGVGKTTVASALALVAAHAGKRTLLAEVDGAGRAACLLGIEPGGIGEAKEARPSLSVMSVDGSAALAEYLEIILPVKRVLHAVLSSRLYQYFVAAAPGLKELMTVGKIWYEAERVDDGERRWDLVIFDAPATGHSLQYLRMPRAAHDAFGTGMVGRESQRIVDLLTDSRRTAVNLVTTAEEMPVNETLEMYQQIRRELHMPLGLLFVNRLHHATLTAADVDRIEQRLATLGDPRQRAAAAEVVSRGREEVGWSTINGTYLEQLRREVEMPAVEIPFAFAEEFGAAHVEAIATAIAPMVTRGTRRAHGNARA